MTKAEIRARAKTPAFQTELQEAYLALAPLIDDMSSNLSLLVPRHEPACTLGEEWAFATTNCRDLVTGEMCCIKTLLYDGVPVWAIEAVYPRGANPFAEQPVSAHMLIN